MHQGVSFTKDFSINSVKRLGHFSHERIDVKGRKGGKKQQQGNRLLIVGCVRSGEH